jgi:hypothetical protein
LCPPIRFTFNVKADLKIWFSDVASNKRPYTDTNNLLEFVDTYQFSYPEGYEQKNKKILQRLPRNSVVYITLEST